jgi:5-methylcytosine-specific restriction endonuclease McrA
MGNLMAKREPMTPEFRWSLYMRSRGKCEFCGGPLRNSGHIHHRLLRSQGGGHTEANCVVIHTDCHDWAHANPAEAYELGWLVRSHLDPADVPIVVVQRPVRGT